MWYQSVSARSIPAARVPRTGIIQTPTTIAQAIAAITFATVDPGGDGGAGAGVGSRFAASLPATMPAPTPTTIEPASTPASVNQPTVPRASESQITAVTPRIRSHRTAGAPLQPGSRSLR